MAKKRYSDEEALRLAICVDVGSKMNAEDVLDTLYPLILKHGKPKYIRSDNGPEFIAQALQE